jgi:hypothetical protein
MTQHRRLGSLARSSARVAPTPPAGPRPAGLGQKDIRVGGWTARCALGPGAHLDASLLDPQAPKRLSPNGIQSRALQLRPDGVHLHLVLPSRSVRKRPELRVQICCSRCCLPGSISLIDAKQKVGDMPIATQHLGGTSGLVPHSGSSGCCVTADRPFRRTAVPADVGELHGSGQPRRT